VAADRADSLPSLFSVRSPLIDPLDAKRISEDLQGIREVDAMLDEVGFSLASSHSNTNRSYTGYP
jgi:hypothetical protein